MIGKTLGQYQIVELLGEGGMASVYRAHQPALDRDVVIKVLLPNLARGRHFVERFQREARAAAALKHPHIVRIYDVGETEGYPFMVMELIDGETLAQKLQREGAISPFTTFTIAEQIGDALDAAHRHGLIHRDVKPGNILLDKEGHAYLTDFGIAKALHDPSLTQVGTVVGTPEYMSPEQVNGQPLDGRSDLYSLAIVLYQMLTGRVPFRADTPLGTLHQQVYNPPTPPSALGLPLGIVAEQALLRALNKEPAARFPDARTMMAALRGQQVGAAPALTPSSTSVPVAAAGVPPKRGRAGRLVSGAAALAILAVASVFGYSWWQGNRTVNHTPPGREGTVSVRTSTDASGASVPGMQPTSTRSITSTPVPYPTATERVVIVMTTPVIVVITATPKPTSTPKPRLRPSATAHSLPPTEPPVPKPSPGMVYTAPVLLGRDRVSFGSPTTLRWDWDGTLQPDEYFDVRIWREEDPHYGVGWTKEREFRYDPASKGPGDFLWSVAVIRGRDGKWLADLSPEATPHHFSSTVGGSSGDKRKGVPTR